MYLGSAPPKTKVGNEICLVFGCPARLVLREVEAPVGTTGFAGRGDMLWRRVAGYAYVHGIRMVRLRRDGNMTVRMGRNMFQERGPMGLARCIWCENGGAWSVRLVIFQHTRYAKLEGQVFLEPEVHCNSNLLVIRQTANSQLARTITKDMRTTVSLRCLEWPGSLSGAYARAQVLPYDLGNNQPTAIYLFAPATPLLITVLAASYRYLNKRYKYLIVARSKMRE